MSKEIKTENTSNGVKDLVFKTQVAKKYPNEH
jgi:hypothetical protein